MGDLEQCEAAEAALGMDGRKPRHILTPEERRKGGTMAHAKLVASGKAHKLTRQDCIAGGLIKRRRHGFSGHALTSEDRRRGGLATAAKRRAKRERDLLTLALPAKRDLEPSQSLTPQQEKRLTEIYLGGQERIELVMAEVGRMDAAKEARELGASLAGKLFVDEEHSHPIVDPTGAIVQPDGCVGPKGPMVDAFTPKLEVARGVLTTDPFTLSALKRFRLGPKSPLALTRSQRAHVTILRETGYLEADGESMLRLTSTGQQAIEEAEDTEPHGVDERSDS